MIEQLTVAAIDAGTNAMRLVVACPTAHGRWSRVHKVREPVRLGHQVFTCGRIPPATVDAAVEAFAGFRRAFERFGVDRYRAVATSATREASNGQTLVRRIAAEAGIELEVIDGFEEARLTRTAVTQEMGRHALPGLIVDIGGGSLELNWLDAGRPDAAASLPIGTVRLMEGFGVTGAIDPALRRRLTDYCATLLDDHLTGRPPIATTLAVGCGGNVEALAKIVGGPRVHGYRVLHLDRLDDWMDEILALDVPGRMEAYGVRRDRAEVMAVAAIALATVGRRTRVDRLVAPDVGVREGVLVELSRVGRLVEWGPSRYRASA